LRILALIEPQDQGELWFAGKLVDFKGDNLLSLRRQVTLVSHSPLVFRSSVRENISFGLKVRGISRPQWPQRIKEALQLVELSGYEHRQAQNLSAGETQRLALARALVFQPRVLLLDEPTANVDVSRVNRIEALISEVNLRFGTTVVLTTHNLSQAFSLTDRVIHLAAGKIVAQAHENIFSGRIQGTGNDKWIEFRGGKIRLDTSRQGHVTCMITPREIQVKKPPLDYGLPNQFPGKVTRLELRNGLARLRVEAGVPFRVDVNPDALAREGITLGSEVGIAFDSQTVKILD